MSLLPGTRLGPYEIVAPLGAGGMGEVYKGRDTRLNRVVALKVLPAPIATDPERRARLEREARAISSLNHPHICALYDIGRQDGVDYLVMEYIEGETLARRLAKGPLPLSDALQTAMAIADALEKAHRAGIVHRDLKPANVMVTKTGSKLLDFGIARLEGPDASDGATTREALTGEGHAIGTPQYMAPEQIEGKPADARADLFALGLVLYEMLTGRKAFQVSAGGSVLAAIVGDAPPPPSTFQSKVTPHLDWIVGRCLVKDRDDRWQSARDLRAELDRVARVAPDTVARDRTGGSLFPWAVAGSALAGVVAISALHFSEATTSPPLVRFAVSAPPAQRFDASPGFAAISPDGQRLAFVATDEKGTRLLWVRALAALVAQPLVGSDGASFPFWSPDAGALAFFADGKLKRINAAGGDLRTLADAPEGMGGTWSRDDVIVYAPTKGDGPLYRVPAAGGPAAPATTVSGRQIGHVAPQFLPDGRRFLYVVEGDGDGENTLGLASLDSTAGTHMRADHWAGRLGRMGSGAMIRYANGYLLWLSSDALVAQKFDVDRLQFEGDAATLVADFSTPEVTQFSGFAVSEAGTLAYRAVTVRHHLVWFDRNGNTQSAPFPIPEQGEPSLSPDDARVAFLRLDPKTKSDIWLWDVARNSTTRLTFDAADDWLPLWSPDGTSIAFASQQRSGVPSVCQLYVKSVDGATAERLLIETPGDTHPNGFFPDGKSLLYDTRDPATRQDLWVLPLAAPPRPTPFLRTTFNEGQGQVSPDGRWIAYTSDESGTWEVYVQPFPATGGKWQISTGGGAEPRWRGDGRELFFIGGNRKLMAVAVSTRGAGLDVGASTPLFDMPIRGPLAGRTAWQRYYAVASDGQRFLVKAGDETTASSPMTVVLNWTSALDR